ncbi:MAG TPA: type II toxin-antitoxin system prevent-host-death family antitoxin [Solirubrobacteraceae bacterium]
MVMLTVSQARASLPELLTRVEDGEQVTITRHGRPVAVLVRPDVIRSRADVIIEDAGRIHELLAAAAASELPDERGKRGGHADPGRRGEPGGPGLTLERAEELISEIRAGRDAR